MYITCVNNVHLACMHRLRNKTGYRTSVQLEKRMKIIQIRCVDVSVYLFRVYYYSFFKIQRFIDTLFTTTRYYIQLEYRIES